MRTRALIFNIAVVATFGFFGHGSFIAQADEIKLKVGVISGLTGAAAKWSAFQNKGMKLAVEDLKREGVDIDLIFEDSQTQATKVISAYNKLRQLDRVDALIANDFNLEPILEAYAGYEAVRIIARAAKIGRTALRLSMRRVKYRGIAGEIDFTKASCAENQASWELFKFVRGRRVRQS